MWRVLHRRSYQSVCAGDCGDWCDVIGQVTRGTGEGRRTRGGVRQAQQLYSSIRWRLAAVSAGWIVQTVRYTQLPDCTIQSGEDLTPHILTGE